MGNTYDIVPTELVVKAMQDSGYRNAAYALAELIDNAVQADATEIELLCIESDELVRQRRRTHLDQVAVLDNGHGMDLDGLRQALQFGNGSHLRDRDGIGRFGMGLPNSSMSQGERVEVWSWQDGPQNALFTYLDLIEIAAKDLREVPRPIPTPIPDIWAKIGKTFSKSGTLVVWARPNRCTWKTARAVVRNSEEIVGRIYRRYLNDNSVRIRMAAYRNTDLNKPTFEHFAKPNDPLYLMANTTCPKPFSKIPMFEPWGDHPRQPITVEFAGEKHTVTLSFSIAKKEAREGHNPGERGYGKHAGRNLGVSIVRADRELELDSKWMPPYDPTARWIGIEVEFPPSLDEVFGVTNNKQSATHLADLAGVDKEELAFRHGFKSYQELKNAWKEDGDIRLPLLNVKDSIESTRGALMGLLKAQTRGIRGKRRHDRNSPETKATEATAVRQREGHTGQSDKAEKRLDPAQKKSEVIQGLVADGVAEETATALAATTVDLGLKYVFAHADSTAGAFFSVKPKGGALLLTLNTSHPAYQHLVSVLEDDTDNATLDEMRVRHGKALDGLKLLLTAWARYEDEAPDGPRRVAAQEAREDWGRVARQFLEGA